jgi:crossover junction endodeoxyribonuclease RusA
MIWLPWPHKALWPNGRPHWAEKAKQIKLHRAWAFAATRAYVGPDFKHDGGRIAIRLTVHPKERGVAPDRDNCMAACKTYLDGIADALGVNDNLFDPQPVVMAGRGSHFVIEIERML